MPTFTLEFEQTLHRALALANEPNSASRHARPYSTWGKTNNPIYGLSKNRIVEEATRGIRSQGAELRERFTVEPRDVPARN